MPEFDPEWMDLQQLKWLAGLISFDTAVAIEVRVLDEGFEVVVGSSRNGPYDYGRTWSFLRGVRAGVSAVSRT